MQEIKTADDLEPLLVLQDNRKNHIIRSDVPDLCKRQPCLLGVDEAGRGPVLGPMVYGICYCLLEVEEDIKTMGCVDSKVINEDVRESKFEKLNERRDAIGWAVEVISPTAISNYMLCRSKVSLNEISHNAAIGLIQQALDSGARITQVYVDTVGPPEKYEQKLSSIFPGIKITVSKKADSLFPIVSAASICAKVCRDRVIRGWKFHEDIDIKGEGWGSGYPGDGVTKQFLTDNIDPVFGFPQLVRFSWSTADKILKENCVPIEWEDVDDNGVTTGSQSIQDFFGVTSNKSLKIKHRFFTDRNIKRVSSL